jgi:hypothetical protein
MPGFAIRQCPTGSRPSSEAQPGPGHHRSWGCPQDRRGQGGRGRAGPSQRIAALSLASARPASTVPPASVSHLAEQNDLFSAAMAAERRGNSTTALRKLDELIARYPGGPLSESARAERQRIQAPTAALSLEH